MEHITTGILQHWASTGTDFFLSPELKIQNKHNMTLKHCYIFSILIPGTLAEEDSLH
jgi:hypothetical protein